MGAKKIRKYRSLKASFWKVLTTPAPLSASCEIWQKPYEFYAQHRTSRPWDFEYWSVNMPANLPSANSSEFSYQRTWSEYSIIFCVCQGVSHFHSATANCVLFFQYALLYIFGRTLALSWIGSTKIHCGQLTHFKIVDPLTNRFLFFLHRPSSFHSISVIYLFVLRQRDSLKGDKTTNEKPFMDG